MSLSSGYLTPKQARIWDFKRRGIQEASIARRLKVTRQTIHKAVDGANNKIGQALMETAKLHRIKITNIDAGKGVLTGYSAEFKTSAIITFSARNGIQVWYKHEGDCNNCEHMNNCRKALLIEMEDREITPFPKMESISPSKLAETLFKAIAEE